MAGKSPFLSERDQGSAFLVRNEGALRGLTSLFPAARLAVIAEISSLAGTRDLLAGQVRTRTERRTSSSRSTSLVTVAARTIHDMIDTKLPYSTCQLYVNLCCDMRILQKVGTQYLLHSYGRPLEAYQRICSANKGFACNRELSLRFYFLDRLLFEDGHYLVATLELINGGLEGLNSEEAGSRLRNTVYEELDERVSSNGYSRVIKALLEEKIRSHTRRAGELTRSLRRTALEYTVRRDWLVNLGLVEVSDKGTCLTSQGKTLLQGLRKDPLDQGLFEARLPYLFSCTFDIAKDTKLDITQALRRTYDAIADSGSSLLETLVLVDTTILLHLPVLLGSRSELLESLRESAGEYPTSLLLQNGYRTRDYFVRARPQQGS